eukprot:CAMPEP_0116115028 /NCGR_PEP_ID=MMETSP0329-20121206/291_1 /TAXON_ID=697910 /ORGANISM="Pseudo-nitzschia arenysensis, Strain B593" /LENGTH=1412 /DNA_ID=CAMNT_0003608439 /DNA_START=125 /DNA_END=4364 /DNA_ORIENTATION=-
MIRCLLILPLVALLLPGKNDVDGNFGCFAFQHHRNPASTRKAFSTSVDQHVPRIRMLNDAIGAATPNTNYFWSNRIKARGRSFRMAATDSESDEGDEEAEKIAKRKVEAEAKQASAEAEAKRLKAEAEKAAKLKAEQDEKLKEAQEMLALLQKEAEARKKAEEDTAKQQAEAEKKRKEAEEEAAKIKAEAEAEEKRKKLEAQRKAEEEAARLKAEAEAKRKQEEEEEKERLKAKEKADELATLLKAKEEAARVMAEIDAKLQAQTAEADKEETARVEKLQSDAEQMPDLDDESDEMLKKMMEEMEKVRIELDLRLEVEAKEAAEKARAEDEAEIEKVKEEEAAKAEAKKSKEEEASAAAAAKAKAEEKAKDEKEADLMDRIKSGATFDPVSKTVTPEQVEEIPPFFSKPKEEPIDTTATTSPKPKPMPDLSSSSKGKPEAKKTDKEDAKPKWMVDWKKDKSNESKPKTPTNDEASKEEVKAAEKTEEKEDEKNESSDPEKKGRSSKENLFDVIGRTASGGVTMDEITEMKKKAKETPPAPTTEVLNKLKKKGPPDSFGQSVATSYRTGNKDKEDSRRVMPDLQNTKELKKKGPPASFGSYAAAASSSGSPTKAGDDTIDSMDKGPPASFGASVAMASSGEVPKDLLSRGTASTDASAPPQPKASTSRKRSDNNIIDVVDVEYTKKDSVSKPKEEPEEEKVPPSRPMGSAPPLEVEKTVPQAPPLQVEKTVPPMKNPSKKNESTETVAKDKSTSATNPIKNIGKAAVEKVFGQKKNEAEEDTKPKPTKEDKEEEAGKEMAMEDRVAQLLKEAFSLSKEDSRVADLLQGVVSITTGKEDKKNKKKSYAKKTSSKGRKTTRQVAVEEEIEEDDEDDDVEDDYDDDEDDYDDDYDDDYEDDYEDDEDDFEEDDDEENDEEDTTIMGSGNRRVEDTNGFGRNANRRAPPNRGMGNSRYMEDTRRPSPFDDIGNDGYFVDDENDYFTYDENDRWRGRGPGAGRREPPMQSGGYSVRPPPQNRGDSLSDSDDDYYFLQFGSPSSRYDEPRGDRYYDDQDDYYDDDYDGAQPGAPRPAYNQPEDDAPKGPPASFGNFVADASMSKTGYAPSTLKDDKFGGSGINGGGGSGAPGEAVGEEFGEEMSQGTGSMLSPRGIRVNGSGGNSSGRGRSAQPHFVVSEDQNDRGGKKKGPPSGFGKSVADAGEHQTGSPMRSVEEEIANGGMATPTGSMATPRRNASSNPSTPQARSGKKKPLFIVSEEEAGPADFGSSVAEASGSKTGWAPQTPKRATSGLEGGTTGGMRPKLKKREAPQSSAPKKKEFGDTVFEDCPPLDSKKKKSEGELPLTRKQSLDTDINQKYQRNPAVNLVDGGASNAPKRPVQYSGSMMAPRIRRKAPPAQPSTPPPVEGDSLEDEDAKE